MRVRVSLLLLSAFATFLAPAAGQTPAAVFNGNVTITGNLSTATLENVVNIDSTSCPVLDDTCISNKLASNTRIKVASGTTLVFRTDHPVNITNLQHFHLSCEPGAVLSIGASWSGSNSLITIQGGSDDVWIEDCQIQGLLCNAGTATATLGSTGISGQGLAAFPPGVFQATNGNNGFIQFDWDGPQEHGAQITGFTSGIALTITDSNPAGGGGGGWNARTFTTQPYRIWYGLPIGVNVQDNECTSNGISTSSLTITVSLSPACNLNAGQMVHIFQAGPYNSFAPGNNQAPVSFGPIVTTGPPGAVTAFTFTWPTSSAPPGPVASGTVAIGPTNVHIVRNYFQGFTQKAILVQTQTNPLTAVGPSAPLTKSVWVESNTIKDCGLTCVSFERTTSDHFDHNFIYNPGQYSNSSLSACQGERNSSYIFSENNKCYLNGNFEDGFNSVFTYGGSESENVTYGTQATNGAMPWPGQGNIINMHLDTAVAMTILGNQTIGGGRGIFPEVNELSRIVDNDVSYAGGQGIDIGKRFDWHTLDNFDSCCGIPGPYSLLLGGIGPNPTTVTPGPLLLAGGTTTCPPIGMGNIQCSQDTANFVEGIASVKVAIASTPVVTGVIVVRNLPCSTGMNVPCNSLSNLKLLDAPVISISVFNPSAGPPLCGNAYPAIDQVRVCKTQVTAQDQNGLPAIGSTNPLGVTLDSQQATNYLCPPSQALNANVLGATANIAQTPLVPAMYTVPGGEWRINWYMSSVVACAGTTVSLTISFTDDTAARTQTTANLSLAANGPTNQAGGTFTIYALAGTAINYSTTLNMCSGTATYNLRLTAEQIQ